MEIRRDLHWGNPWERVSMQCGGVAYETVSSCAPLSVAGLLKAISANHKYAVKKEKTSVRD